MSVELPKDAEGREIPLDTEVLYMSDGTSVDVDEFNFSTGYSAPEHKWTVKLMNYAVFFTTRMFLNPPEPPDGWEKLEEDLDSCSASTRYAPCAYFSKTTDSCEKCPADPSKECLVQMVKHIALRIHKLRGEDE